MPMSKENLESDSLEFDFLENVRSKILKDLKKSGFSIIYGKNLFMPELKDFMRKVLKSFVKFLRDKREFIEKVGCDCIEKYIIDGNSVKPKTLGLRLY